MIRKSIKHVVCGISGGVDSAVAAFLLKKKGYQVTGAFMRNWDAVDEYGRCTANEDLEDAQYVCQELDIKLHEVNFVKEYWNDVFCATITGYQNAITPNPDIMCNKYIKFDAFFDYAINKLGAKYVATGHYARTSFGEDMEKQDKSKGVRLLKGVDQWKDQTFFLSQVNQMALQKTLFPLGEFRKEVVRKIAEAAGLGRIAKKKESMGMCFIGKRDFKRFIEEYIAPRPGAFIDVETKKIVGTHKGAHYFTVGERINLSGQSRPYYVVERNAITQDIIVAPGTNHPALFTTTFFTDSVHWIHSAPRQLLQDQMMDCEFRFQRVHPLLKCTLTLTGNNCVIVNLSQPMRAITPGQYAVFYKDEECLGSGPILRTGASLYTLDQKTPVQNPKEYT